jgi:O-antigen ligase
MRAFYSIQVRKILVVLSYLYVALIPFEEILLFFFEIDTVLKPYRIIALFILFFSLLYKSNSKGLVFITDKLDYLLLSIHAIGLFITLIYLLIGEVNVPSFINDGSQTLFIFLVYISLKKINFERDEFINLLKIFVFSMLFSVGNIIYNFYFISIFERQSGFLSSPNSASRGIVISIFVLIYLLFKNIKNQKSFYSLINLTLLAVFFLGLLATGSRAGLVAVIMGITIFFIMGLNGIPWKKFSIPITLIAITITISQLFSSGLSIIPQQEDNYVFQRYNVEESEENVRVYIWQSGINVAFDHFLMGVGIGQYKEYHNFYIKQIENVPLLFKTREDPLGLHNAYLYIFVQYGVIPFLLFLFYLYKNVYRTFFDSINANEQKLFKVLLLVLLLQVIMFIFFNIGFLDPIIWFTLFIISYRQSNTWITPIHNEYKSK